MNTGIVTTVAAFSRSDLEDLINEQVHWLTVERPDYLGFDLPKTGPVTVEYALNFLPLSELQTIVREAAQSRIYEAIMDAQITAAMLVRDEYDTEGVFA
jgi:hypothetical protein